MELRPVSKRSASEAVFQQLFGAVIEGQVAPGDPLPAERTLTESLKVNRQAVREALQRLAQAGLVSISQGETTKVLDYRRSAGLDLLPRLLLPLGGEPEPGTVRSVMEMRAAIGPDVARLAALRSTSAKLDELSAIVDAMAETDDLGELAGLDLDFWDVLVDASDNIAYRLAFNSLRSIYEPLAGVLADVLEDELRDQVSHERIASAVISSDENEAGEVAKGLLAKGTAAVNLLIAIDKEG